MKYGSVCSGIEAATVAWHPLGWEAQWFAEIEAFPSSVLAHHYPSVKNLGDFTKIGDTDGSIELLVGGTPCQSFSVAGKRLGMGDPRGNLAIEFLRLAERMRPAWVVFENVPGLLSSDNGRDFHAFLSLLGECGYGYAYRVLDAQYFGVPQRRRRVFVVGYLGDWRPAASVLFERESLSRNTPPRREAGERLADTLSVGANQYSGFTGEPVEVARTNRARGNADKPESDNFILARCDTSRNQRIDAESETFVVKTANTKAQGSNVGVGDAYTLDSAPNQAIAFQQNTRDEVRLMGGDGQIAGALASEPGMKQQNYIAFNWQSGQGVQVSEDQAGTVIRNQVQAVGLHREYQGDRVIDTDGLWPTLPSQGANNGGGAGARLRQQMSVRRLTPRECERLQGFPDDYTAIRYRGKPAADGPRYRALGNSMAVPVMAWIGRRIEAVNTLQHAQVTP